MTPDLSDVELKELARDRGEKRMETVAHLAIIAARKTKPKAFYSDETLRDYDQKIESQRQVIHRLLLDAEDGQVHIDAIAKQLGVDTEIAGAWMIRHGKGLWTFGSNTRWWKPLARKRLQE